MRREQDGMKSWPNIDRIYMILGVVKKLYCATTTLGMLQSNIR